MWRLVKQWVDDGLGVAQYVPTTVERATAANTVLHMYPGIDPPHRIVTYIPGGKLPVECTITGVYKP